MQQPVQSVLVSLKFRPRWLLSVRKYVTNITELISLKPLKVKALSIICLDFRKKKKKKRNEKKTQQPDTLPHNRSIYKARQHNADSINNVLNKTDTKVS